MGFFSFLLYIIWDSKEIQILVFLKNKKKTTENLQYTVHKTLNQYHY